MSLKPFNDTVRNFREQIASGLEIKGDTTTLEDLGVLAKLVSGEE